MGLVTLIPIDLWQGFMITTNLVDYFRSFVLEIRNIGMKLIFIDL